MNFDKLNGYKAVLPRGRRWFREPPASAGNPLEAGSRARCSWLSLKLGRLFPTLGGPGRTERITRL